MLVPCPHCDSVIHNNCTECPWCSGRRHPNTQYQRQRYQISLFGLMLLLSMIGAWVGILIQGE